MIDLLLLALLVTAGLIAGFKIGYEMGQSDAHAYRHRQASKKAKRKLEEETELPPYEPMISVEEDLGTSYTLKVGNRALHLPTEERVAALENKSSQCCGGCE